MRFFQTGLISALVALASAYTTPDYSQPPLGNAILKPGLDEQVPVGKPYTITWDPTTEGLVSLVLLRGASTNVVPLYPIAESIPNNGQFVWTPSTELENDITHYGLLLVVESGANKGQYQWSTQFGISNPGNGDDSTTTTSTSTSTTSIVIPTVTEPTTPAGTPTTPPAHGTVTKTTTLTTTTCPEAGTATSSAGSVIPPTTITTIGSSTHVQWTPTSTPAAPQFTGAAGRNAISLGAIAAGVAAVLAF